MGETETPLPISMAPIQIAYPLFKQITPGEFIVSFSFLFSLNGTLGNCGSILFAQTFPVDEPAHHIWVRVHALGGVLLPS